MKRALSLLLLISSTAFACPQLSGNYTSCKNIEGFFQQSAELTIMQRQNIFHVISMNANSNERTADTYRADGVIYTQNVNDSNTGSSYSYSTKAICQGQNLIIETVLYSDHLTVVMTKQNGKLYQRFQGNVQGQNVDALQVCE